MDTATLKKEIADKINKIDDEATLQNLDLIVNELLSGSRDFWDHLPEHIKTGIEQAQSSLRKARGFLINK
jgi:hypothetical protein